MSSPHRIHHDLYRGPKEIVDPGNAGQVRVSKDLQICELVTTGAETRTLATPTKAGIRFLLRMKTDGGDAVVTAAGTLNVAGNTVATFADVGDQLDLISVAASSGYRWDILVNPGSVGLA